MTQKIRKIKPGSIIVACMSAILIGLVAAPHPSRAGSHNEYEGFYGATPVAQQPNSTDLLVALQNYGLIGTGTSATPLDLKGGVHKVGSLTITSSGTAAQPNPPTIITGTASPVSSLVANPGTIDVVVASGTCMIYIKKSGTDSSGWVTVSGT